jgi:hypothetical protein
LQHFAGGARKKCTVMLNPDDLRQVTVLSEESKEIITADLKMTTFADLTLEEALAVMRSASEANPELRTLHESHLSEARRRRVRESGFYPDSNLPSSYSRIDKLRKDAADMANVEFAPMYRSTTTMAAGKIMDRTNSTGPRDELSTQDEMTAPAAPEDSLPSKPSTQSIEPDALQPDAEIDQPSTITKPMFNPIKESKV